MQNKGRFKFINFFLIVVVTLVSGLCFYGTAFAVKGKIYTQNGKYYKKQGYFIFKDNPKMEYKDYIITAEVMEYYEEEERATFSGNVVVIQGETKITSESMEADLNSDEFIFENSVYIFYVRKSKDEKPKTGDENGDGTGPEKKSNEVIEIKADHVKYYSGDNDHLVATGKVILDMDDENIKSDYLEYKGGEEIVFAKGNVEVLGKDEEKLFCEEFTYILEGEEEGFTAVGEVELEFTIDEEEEQGNEE